MMYDRNEKIRNGAVSYSHPPGTLGQVSAPVKQACLTDALLGRQQELNESMIRNIQRLTTIADRLFGGQPSRATEKKDQNGPGAMAGIEALIMQGQELNSAIMEQIERLEVL